MEELMIKADVQNPVLKELLNRLEKEYGCLITNSGCICNNSWLSVKAITMMIHELDVELRNNGNK